jgi:hypothetical protein
VMLCSCGDPACGAVGKHPLTAHGLKDATSDPTQLGRWWRRWPQANIGLVTGERADVLDVDGPAGRAALHRFTADHDLRLEGPLVRTGSGWHVYLAPTGSGNRAGLLEQVDWRGRGGYVIAPPSRHASGRRYRWLRPLTAELPTAPVPLRSLLDPARAQPSRPATVCATPCTASTPAGHPYGRTALKQELSAVAHAPKGSRNHTLYLAGIRLYRLVAGGVLTRDEVETGLPYRRGNLRAPGRGTSPDPPHPRLRRMHRAHPPPRRPSPHSVRPPGTGPKVEPAGARS